MPVPDGNGRLLTGGASKTSIMRRRLWSLLLLWLAAGILGTYVQHQRILKWTTATSSTTTREECGKSPCSTETQLPCVDRVLERTRQHQGIPVQWKQYFEFAISSLTYQGRERWVSTLNPVIIPDAATLKARLEPISCPITSRRGTNVDHDDEDVTNVAIAAITNGVVSNTQEWLFYHLLLGVTKIFFCDDSLPGSLEQARFHAAIQPFVEAGYLELVESSMFVEKNATDDYQAWHLKQRNFYDYVLKEHGKRFRWIGFFDTDEFVIPRARECLPDFLEEYNDYGGLGLQWNPFSMIGVVHHDFDKSYFEQYRYPIPDHGRHVKSFVQPPSAEKYAIHNAFHKEGYYAVNVLKQRVPEAFNHQNLTEEESFGKAEVRHIVFGDLFFSLYEKMCGSTGFRVARAALRVDQIVEHFDQASNVVPLESDSSLRMLLPPLHSRLLSGLYNRNSSLS